MHLVHPASEISEADERRREERFPFPSMCTYSPHESGHPEEKGVTINLSRSGACIYVFSDLEAGRKLYLRSELPVRSSVGTVRWVCNVSGQLYMAGVSFE